MMYCRLFLTLLLLHLPSSASQSCPNAPQKPATSAPGMLLMQVKSTNALKLGDASAAAGQRRDGLSAALDALQAALDDFQAQVNDVGTGLTSMTTQCCQSCGNNTVPEETVTTTETTTTTLPRPNLCAVFGDPHFITFDGAQTIFVGDALLWLVKSRDISLQAVAKDSGGKFLGFAAGGNFLQGHTLIVYNRQDGGALQVLLDGEQILNGSTSEFHIPGLLDAFRSESWDSSRFDDEILSLRTHVNFNFGTWASRFAGSPQGGLLMFRLPAGVEVTISGMDFMSAVIAMQAEAEGQSGYCGNFNGDPRDDAEPVAPSWDKPIGPDLDPISEADSLFASSWVPALLSTASVRRESNSDALKAKLNALHECPPDLLALAQLKCDKLINLAFQTDCVFDVCVTGQVEAADEVLIAEVMTDKVNARGYPRFVGYGQCLDQHQRLYRAFDTNLRTETDCQDVLRQLANVRGVVGSQLRVQGNCQVLVEGTIDPTVVMIHQGWAAAANTTGSTAEAASPEGEASDSGPAMGGKGSVSSATVDASWTCWKLN